MFAASVIVLVLMHMLLHSAGRSFSISRPELLNQAITALVLTLVLSVVRGRR